MSNLDKLLAIMAQLRDPQTGCPWDREQTPKSVVPHTIEEAYEVAEAAEQGDATALKDELGDLLLQVVFLARIAQERSLFNFDDVAGAIVNKLVRRHPHVFGDEHYDNETEQSQAWEQLKAQERGDVGALAGVSRTLPALTRAVKLQKRASRVGFDWDDPEPILGKIDEELDELEAEIQQQASHERLEDELGDVFFAVANLARHLKLDPERATRSTNRKFSRRFEYLEASLAAQGRRPEQASLEEMDVLWEAAKAAEKKNGF